MADRHFDLNKAIEVAQPAEGEEPDGWFTFDLGPNFQPPAPDPQLYVDAARLAASSAGEDMDAWQPPEVPSEPPERKPWRINRDGPAGWTVMKWLTATSNFEQVGLTQQLIRDAVDPEQWAQFEAHLIEARVPMSKLEQILQLIVRDQLGLPLDL